MAKSKKKSRKQIEKESRKLIVAVRKETRLDTLRGLRSMMVNGITIDIAALNVMIQEVEEATTVVEAARFSAPLDDDDELPHQSPTWTPDDLAQATGVSARSIREFLREFFPLHAPGRGSTWKITPHMAEEIFKRWPKGN